MSDLCEACTYYTYSDDIDAYECPVTLDEDDLYRFYSGHHGTCPYFRADDEYRVVRRQN